MWSQGVVIETAQGVVTETDGVITGTDLANIIFLDCLPEDCRRLSRPASAVTRSGHEVLRVWSNHHH